MAGEVEKKRLSMYKKTIKGQAEVEEGSNYLPVSTLSSRQDPKEKPAFFLMNLYSYCRYESGYQRWYR